MSHLSRDDKWTCSPFLVKESFFLPMMPGCLFATETVKWSSRRDTTTAEANEKENLFDLC